MGVLLHGIGKLLTTFLLIGILNAPFQCAAEPDPDRRLEDTGSEALFRLSERFAESGEEHARRFTLEELIRQYPNSREAVRARLILEESSP